MHVLVIAIVVVLLAFVIIGFVKFIIWLAQSSDEGVYVEREPDYLIIAPVEEIVAAEIIDEEIAERDEEIAERDEIVERDEIEEE